MRFRTARTMPLCAFGIRWRRWPSYGNLVQWGIIAFAAIVLFQLVTLPVEFNASSRALAALEGGGFLARDEVDQSRKVLSAAALTYVAAAIVGILQLLRLVLIFGNRRD